VYRNFERSLALAPAEATWVALADQDDRWYPEKLETLRDHLGSATLVYGDMRVVDSRGAVLSDTYWTYRRNNHTNFASLMLANTVTGAAALFRRELLDRALPFPPLVGNAYHDHWIACVAMASGRITYVDRPLHDYVQHGEAAQGHLSANLLGVRRPRRGRLTRLGERLTKLRERRFRPGGEYLYFEVVCRIALSARVLEMRCGELMTRRKRRVARGLATCDRSLAGAVWMAVRSARPWLGWNETFGIERLLVHGIVWRRVAAWLAGPARVLPVFRDHHPRAEGHEL
jgi:hypothetical protein